MATGGGADPDPVLMFAHTSLYPMEGAPWLDAGAVGMDRARVRYLDGVGCLPWTLSHAGEAKSATAPEEEHEHAQNVEGNRLLPRTLINYWDSGPKRVDTTGLFVI